MLLLLRYLKGYVRIRMKGAAAERFFNLCSNRELLLWDIVKEEDSYTLSMSLEAFYQLRPIVKKTKTKVVILKRVGLPFLVPGILKRKAFIAGFVLCIAFWIIAGHFIWDIQCRGNLQITEDVMLAFLKQNQVKVGMLKKDLDISALEKAIRKEFHQVTWTSVKQKGTMLLVEIKENDVALVPQIPQEQEGKDLVSAHDGEIVSIIVRTGVPKVAAGDVVEKGTVLVEGKVPVMKEDATIKEYLHVTADADIIIKHEMNYVEELPKEYIEKCYTGREKKGIAITMGEQEIKIMEAEPFLQYDSLTEDITPGILEKLSLPFGIGVIKNREYINVERQYDKAQAKELLTEKLNHYMMDITQNGVHIVEKSVTIKKENAMWKLTALLIVEEEAAALKK